MNSYVAETIALLKVHLTGLGGITPQPLPPNALFPYITAVEIKTKDVESLEGSSGVQFVIIQLNCWDKDYEMACFIRDAAKAYLLPFKGTAGTRTIQGVNQVVDATLFDGVRSLHQAMTRLRIAWSQ